MKKLLVGKLSLPLDTVTQSLAILARKRAGKSYLARGIAEQLLAADQQVVIIDPKGDWWGIRSSSDGKRPGFPVVVLGGEHGDLPLEKTAAETVARLIVEEHVSVLLDLSEFRKYEVALFLGGDVRSRADGLLEIMYRLKAKEDFRTPLMLIVDEADAIAPQKPSPGEERMLGAMSDIVRRAADCGCDCGTEHAGGRPATARAGSFHGRYTNLNSKGFTNAIGALRSAGYIEYPGTGTIALTESGQAQASGTNAPRSSKELQDRLIGMLGGATGRIVRELVSVYPDALQRGDLAAKAGYGNLNSKGFTNAIGRLRTLGFIDYPAQGTVAARPVLFIEKD